MIRNLGRRRFLASFVIAVTVIAASFALRRGNRGDAAGLAATTAEADFDDAFPEQISDFDESLESIVGAAQLDTTPPNAAPARGRQPAPEPVKESRLLLHPPRS